MQMPGLNPTAPFGPRPLSATALRAQRNVTLCAGKAAHKWRMFRHVCEARAELRLSDRSLTVLNALLSFHPDTVLTLGSDDLVVFPSNRELSVRAHGIPASTLRRHIAALVDAGLILRRDSPNGKRYVRRAPGGGIEQTFGFDLSPLVASADELAGRAARTIEERRAVDALREQITLARRDIAKMLSFGVEQHVDAGLPALHREYRELLDSRPRAARRETLEPLAAALAELSKRILHILENQIEDAPPRDATGETECPASEGSYGAGEPRQAEPKGDAALPVPVRLVAERCPDFVDYAREGLRTARDVTDTAAIVRPLLGVSPSAWEETCVAMGPGLASVTLALILQRGSAIRNPGGYLRTLARRASAGQFSVWPMLMALGATQRQKSEAARTPPTPSFPDEGA
ncbi:MULTISPECIES: plasmid replication protein RepC [Hyphomicrobiales]|uniref:plasmid replication protein RepC n=1 Tax=Hyphomicrobiales TaxID=356 RepID=UPI0003DF01FB|nr:MULTISPECIES: plasmid replication protein RepC [Hyphomicrobiales]CAH1662724.1 putative replication protein C [Hyphomicrobiales bacterium]ETR79455.1 replication protein C [Afipia sp. P52-10]MBS7743625.1 replication initiation protein RepC [Chelatococcus sp. HY11]MBX3546472.1 replication initiation protein RepC [Chelatococcus sp.]MCO5079690.1 replication initiation protein RepC [Chelatococcus sp.]